MPRHVRSAKTVESEKVKAARIAVTGVGLITPLGVSCAQTWQRLMAAERAPRWIRLGTDGGARREGIFSMLYGAAPPGWPEGPRSLIAYARQAAREAAARAALPPAALPAAACVIGTSKIDLSDIDQLDDATTQWAGNDAITARDLFASSAAAAVASDLGCEAAAFAPVAACATGLLSVVRAAQLIREGVCPVALAGGADASLHPGLLASYARLGVLAPPGDDPARACRPFARDRCGFAVGEGAGMLLLEDWEHALRRGARPLAEWIDGLCLSDPTGLTTIDESGEALDAALTRLRERPGCGWNRQSPPVISVHGTATRMNDLAEGNALRRHFGSAAARLPGFGVKGALGHLMGAAGAAEAAISVLALHEQTLPPTVNHDEPDPECAIDFHAGRARPMEMRSLLKISLGFGGHLAVGLFRRAEP